MKTAGTCALVAMVVLVGCETDPDVATTSAGAAGAGGEGSAVGTGGTGGAGGSEGYVTRHGRGLVYIGNLDPPDYVIVTGWFVLDELTGSGFVPACTDVTVGACSIRKCANLEPPTDAMLTTHFASAGAIDVLGRDVAVHLPAPDAATLEANDGFYPDELLSGTVWPPGEVFDVTVEGAEVPPYHLPVTIPFAPTITEPATLVGLTLDRSQPFVVRWAPPPVGMSGDVQLQLAGTIWCSAPVGAGEIVVAPELLGELLPETAKLDLMVVDQPTLELGEWTVGVIAYALLPMPDPHELSFGEVSIE